jgi:hypothetical protein
MHEVLCHPYKEGDLIWIEWYYQGPVYSPSSKFIWPVVAMI